MFLLLCLPALFYSCTCYPSQDGKTSLLCAAEAGHEKVVAYLLKFQAVLTELKKQPENVDRASVSDIVQTWFYECSLYCTKTAKSLVNLVAAM